VKQVLVCGHVVQLKMEFVVMMVFIVVQKMKNVQQMEIVFQPQIKFLFVKQNFLISKKFFFV
jgi:hypothetical protein